MSYLQIVIRNLCTWFNAMVLPAAMALFFLGEYQGAIAVSGMAVVNTALGLFHELRAKRHLDKLAILVETRVKVRRAGTVQELLARAVHVGDHVFLAGGDPVVADGQVLEARFLEIDEALLTGESDPVRRNAGDALLSGSVCVAGEGIYRADKVGQGAFASQIAFQARQYHASASPLTRIINRLVQILSLSAIALIVLYTIFYFAKAGPQSDANQRAYVRMVAATITSMVPQGMVLTATIAFMLGAIVLSRRGAIVQRLGAVETMAAIDVLCTDKTGTLTTNRLRLEAIDRLDSDLSDEEVAHQLRVFVSASVDQDNRNLRALRAALGTTHVELLEQIPFKAQNRYSAVWVREAGRESVLVLGAIEALASRVQAGEDFGGSTPIYDRLLARALLLQQRGSRLLLFAQTDRGVILRATPVLPEIPLHPLALVSLEDELRPEASAVLAALAAQGIAVKILSGDNPETVRATVRHLNLSFENDVVTSGQEFSAAEDPAAFVGAHSVFGRVAPEQKVRIIQLLQQTGAHVAMIGDGVNDVLPIKRADLGIAMGEGSQASKRVSGLVLENNNFALLPETLEEGRLIVRNLRRSAKLFLVKNVYSLILIVAYAVGLFEIPFPYVPQQVTLLNWLVIGLPALVIALSREPSIAATKPRFLREVGWFALRTGVIFGAAGVAILWIGSRLHPEDERAQRTLLLSVLIFLGITALWRALRDGEPAEGGGDRRFRLLGILALPVYLGAMYVPICNRFFELAELGIGDWLTVIVVAAVAYGMSLCSDKIKVHTTQ